MTKIPLRSLSKLRPLKSFIIYADTNSSRTSEKKDPDEEMYKLVGRKLVCLGHPVGCPQTALDIGLKDKRGQDGEIDK